MRNLVLGIGIVAVVGGLALVARSSHDGSDDKIARGMYLVNYGGCSDCHTPVKMGEKGPEPDMTRYMSGHPEKAQLPPPPKLGGPWFAATGGFTAWAGPWGISYAANLTPDKNTGLGTWDEKTFIQAMRTGTHYGVARPILPPMPWKSISALNDQDLSAILTYLKSLPPVRNQVPEPVPPSGPVSFE